MWNCVFVWMCEQMRTLSTRGPHDWHHHSGLSRPAHIVRLPLTTIARFMVKDCSRRSLRESRVKVTFAIRPVSRFAMLLFWNHRRRHADSAVRQTRSSRVRVHAWVYVLVSFCSTIFIHTTSSSVVGGGGRWRSSAQRLEVMNSNICRYTKIVSLLHVREPRVNCMRVCVCASSWPKQKQSRELSFRGRAQRFTEGRVKYIWVLFCLG